jgi:hypothetical protein
MVGNTSSNESYHTCISKRDNKHSIFYTKIQVDSSATKEMYLGMPMKSSKAATIEVMVVGLGGEQLDTA